MASSESITSLLKTIRASAETTEESIRKITKELQSNNELPSFIQANNNSNNATGVSLLSLKNDALLSYVNSLGLLMLSKVEELKGVDDDAINKAKEKSIENTVVQRVVLERGVKGLENKISYQLDKMVRAYNRAKDEDKKGANSEKLSKEEKENSNDENEDEDDEDSDADLNFKPNAMALVSKLDSKNKKKNVKSDSTAEGEKYRPPKISAVAPPVANADHRQSNDGKNENRRRKLQSMEEYIAEHGDAPMVARSIGSNIVDHGRGGIKTNREQAKEDEIERYEEENFTRLPSTMTKKTGKEKRNAKENNFFGEDWSIFGNNNDKGFSGNSRKKSSAWDRAKKRKTR
ncbi:Lcp5 protein [Saccharomycopsis crataegensis]|uniref:Lcp5 protein n=1 Tax=Saccharomycopsis crataegensis TaxID=43959 RepID=A0AAV5QQ36_9ASCO|nr:Lcp5 protein [Saccharomycopsis crataegensis]